MCVCVCVCVCLCVCVYVCVCVCMQHACMHAAGVCACVYIWPDRFSNASYGPGMYIRMYTCTMDSMYVHAAVIVSACVY